MTSANVIEAMLLRWGESHSSGRTVTLQLPEADGPHPFKGLKCGPANGQRLAVSIALINDDESQSEPATKERRKFEELKRSQQAGMLCDDKRFQVFMDDEKGANFVAGLSPEQQAATAVRKLCGVNTRAAFDSNKEAAAKWDTLHSEYTTWCRT